MGSTLEINDQSVWMPQSGSFDLALELLSSHLEKDNPELAAFIREPIGKFPYLDLGQLSGEQFAEVKEAAIEIYEAILRDLSNSKLADSHFVHTFGQLKTMLLLDKRVVQIDDTGIIKLNANSIWEAAGWMYDLVLEYIFTKLNTPDNQPLAVRLMRIWATKSRKADLISLNNTELRAVFSAVEFMHGYYGDCEDGRGRISYSPTFLSAFAPKIEELYNLFRQDHRLIENS